MTTRALSAEKKYFAPKFFLNTLSKSWTNFLLYFVICFFTLPVPILISTDSEYYRLNPMVDFDEIVYRVTDMLRDLNLCYMFIAAAIAVFAGCAVTRYLNSKTSTNFYHSLPITREALYFTKTLVGIIDYIAALVLSVSISALVLFITIGASFDIVMTLLTILGYAVLTFLLVFFICVFVGMFCGTTGVQFVMTGVAIFTVPAVYSTVLLFMDDFMRYFDMGWYMENAIMYTSPVLRLLFVYDKPFSAIEIVIFALIVLVFAFLALIVYRGRKNENAENPIVFPKAATFLKYVIMIPATLAFGIWFYEMGGGLWLVFGFVAGALLTFMLINAVFQKNARAMFKGIRGLMVFGVVFTLCFLAMAFDILNLDEYIPGTNLVSRVEIVIDGDDYGSYKDKKLIDVLGNDLKRYMNSHRDHEVPYVSAAESVDREQNKDIVCQTGISVSVVYHTKLGAPVAKHYSYIPKEEFTDTLKALANSDEFEKHIYEYIDFCYELGYEYIDIPIGKFFDVDIVDFVDDIHAKHVFLEAYKRDLGDITYETFQNPEVGYIFKRVRESSRIRMEFPLFMNSNNTLELLLAGDDLYDIYIDSIHSISVYRTENEKNTDIIKEPVASYTDEKEIRAILSSVANATDNHGTNVFCEYDYRYFVAINYFKDAEQICEDGKYDFDEDYIGAVSYFIKGKVPAFIENALK